MDVGGGNGILLAEILKAHTELCGVLADLPHVLERAQQRGYLDGELSGRVELRPCDFFLEIPCGCCAYLMKNVIHDWDDERARKILMSCRRAVPSNGALLLLEWGLPEGNIPALGKFVDITMLLLTGGKERTMPQYRELLAGSGFRLSKVWPVPGGFNIIESLPV